MKYAAISMLFLVGCSVGGGEYPYPFPDAAPVDGGTFIVPVECIPEDVDTDFHNCGACGAFCSPADADSCVMGTCLCGVSAACTGLTDCRVGRCVPQDPEGLVCEHDDWCTVNEACIEGRCSFVECVPETCDGLDNDCDGVVDNGAGDGPLSQFCIGDRPAMGSGYLPPCRSGVRVCDSGTWTECVGDVAPLSETGLFSCDGVDNDCDGCVDGALTDGVCESRRSSIFDVVFAIDQSGSMHNKIGVVRQAVRLFSARLSSLTAFRYAIIRIPGDTDGVSELYQDLTVFTAFESALQGMPLSLIHI